MIKVWPRVAWVAPLLLACTLDLVEPAADPPALSAPYPAFLDVALTVSRGVADSLIVDARLFPGTDSAGKARRITEDTLVVGTLRLPPRRDPRRSGREYHAAIQIAPEDSSIQVVWPAVAGVPTPPGSIIVRFPRRVGTMDPVVPPGTDLSLAFDMGAGSIPAPPLGSRWYATLLGSGGYIRSVDGRGELTSPLVLPAAWLAEIEPGAVTTSLFFLEYYDAGAGTGGNAYRVQVRMSIAIRWNVTRVETD